MRSVLTLCILIVPLFGTPLKLTQEEQSFIKAYKEIKMCIDPDWMPLEAIENSKMIGLNKEFIDLVQTHLPIPIRLIPTKSWSQSIEFAKARECDMLSLVMATPSRKEYLNFTSNYLEIPNVVVTRQNISHTVDITHFYGKRVGVVKNYAMAEILKNAYPKINFIDMENVHDGLHHVQSGMIDAFTATSVAIAYNSRTLNRQLQKRLDQEIDKVREQDKMIFHQNKLVSMGEMIENIAHQWRQPLAQVNSAVSVIDNQLFHKEFHDAVVESKLFEIEKMTQYMSNTIDDFNHFLDDDKPKELFNLHRIIEQAIDILKGSLESCQIEMELDVDKEIYLRGYPQ